jgi:hypothetical protein
MFEERWLCAFDELGKLLDVVEVMSIYATEISAQMFEKTFISFLVGYISEERIQDTLNTQ